MISYIIVGVVGVFCVKWFLQNDPPRKSGIYTQRNKWYLLKYVLFRIMMWLRKKQNSRSKVTSGSNAGYGMRSRTSPIEMDKIQALSPNHPQAVDAVYFNGGNKDGYFLVAATARRHQNIVQTILFLRIPGVGLFQLPSLPDTTLTATTPNTYSAGGLILEVLEPMKTWKIVFEGALCHVESGELKSVKFDLTWTALTTYFDFDTDLHPSMSSDAIATEKWSREYFNKLQTVHQTHYEQFGEITGDIHIEERKPLPFTVRGVRDHSYGNIRDWKYFHRYCMQYGYFSDGTCLLVGAISMPMCMSRLHVGYLILPDDTIIPVSEEAFEFYNFGDEQPPPQKLAFTFVAGGKTYSLNVEVLQCPTFYMGADRDSKIYEQLCRYKLNGIDGWGIAEWAYRNYTGKELELKNNERYDALFDLPS